MVTEDILGCKSPWKLSVSVVLEVGTSTNLYRLRIRSCHIGWMQSTINLATGTYTSILESTYMCHIWEPWSLTASERKSLLYR
jgi:hypothetical protein